MRHRAAGFGDRVRYVKEDTNRQGLRKAVDDAPVTVHHPTSRAARDCRCSPNSLVRPNLCPSSPPGF